MDLGTKTIGLALSDVERRIATPLVTLRRTAFARDAEALSERDPQVRSLRADPRHALTNSTATNGPRAQSTRAFARNFAGRDPTPIAYWDERLSTAAVARDLIAHDVSRARRAEVIDKMAAAYILQGALDKLARLASNDRACVRKGLGQGP